MAQKYLSQHGTSRGFMLIGGGIAYFLVGPGMALGAILLGLYFVIQSHFQKQTATPKIKSALALSLVIVFVMVRPYLPNSNEIRLMDRFTSTYDYPRLGVGITGPGAGFLGSCSVALDNVRSFVSLTHITNGSMMKEALDICPSIRKK